MLSITPASQRLNQALVLAEEAFRLCRSFRCRAAVTIGTDTLLFCKLDNKWCLAVNGLPITTVSMAQRIAAAQALPQLWEACKQASTEHIEEINRVAAEVEDWVDSVDLECEQP